MIQNLHIGTYIRNILPERSIGMRANNEFVNNEITNIGQPNLMNYYIPFQPNAINTAKISNKTFEVFSYNFSGCLMAIWIDRLDTICVAHISTGQGQDCTRLWDTSKVNFKAYAEFKPSDYINVSYRNGNYPLYGCYGVIVCNGKLAYTKFYSITCVADNSQPVISYIEEVDVHWTGTRYMFT